MAEGKLLFPILLLFQRATKQNRIKTVFASSLHVPGGTPRQRKLHASTPSFISGPLLLNPNEYARQQHTDGGGGSLSTIPSPSGVDLQRPRSRPVSPSPGRRVSHASNIHNINVNNSELERPPSADSSGAKTHLHERSKSSASPGRHLRVSNAAAGVASSASADRETPTSQQHLQQHHDQGKDNSGNSLMSPATAAAAAAAAMRKEREDYEERIRGLTHSNQDQSATIKGLLQRVEELQTQVEHGRAREQALQMQLQGENTHEECTTVNHCALLGFYFVCWVTKRILHPRYCYYAPAVSQKREEKAMTQLGVAHGQNDDSSALLETLRTQVRSTEVRGVFWTESRRRFVAKVMRTSPGDMRIFGVEQLGRDKTRFRSFFRLR